MPRTAELLVASAPRPYTVSVGNATGMEDVRRTSAAFKIFSDSGRDLWFSNQDPRSSIKPDGGWSDLIERIWVVNGTVDEVPKLSMVENPSQAIRLGFLVDQNRFNASVTAVAASVSSISYVVDPLKVDDGVFVT